MPNKLKLFRINFLFPYGEKTAVVYVVNMC